MSQIYVVVLTDPVLAAYIAEAGWQPIVYSKTAARLLKATWCLLRIATPCAVLKRLTEVAGRPAARRLHGTNLPPSH